MLLFIQLFLFLQIDAQTFLFQSNDIQFDMQDNTLIITHQKSTAKFSNEEIKLLTKNVFPSINTFLSFAHHDKTVVNCTKLNTKNMLGVNLQNNIFEINIYFTIIFDSFNNTENEINIKNLQLQTKELYELYNKLSTSKFKMISYRFDIGKQLIFENDKCRFINKFVKCVCPGGENSNGYVWYDAQKIRRIQNCTCNFTFVENENVIKFKIIQKVLFNNIIRTKTSSTGGWNEASYLDDCILTEMKIFINQRNCFSTFNVTEEHINVYFKNYGMPLLFDYYAFGYVD